MNKTILARPYRRAHTVVRAASESDVQDAMKAAKEAIKTEDGTSAQDVCNFYEVLNAPSWEKANEAVLRLVAEEKLTEGVLDACWSAIEQSEKQGAEDNVKQTLQNLYQLLVESYQQLHAPPSLRLIEELNALDPVGHPEEVKARLAEVLDKPDFLSKDAFFADVKVYLQAMSAQDSEFEEQVAQLGEPTVDQLVMIKQTRDMRGEAKAQMQAIHDILFGI